MCVIATGSPPRGRGKEVGPLPLLGGTRITPAWAGKRLPLPDIAAQTQDHPRVGGEKSGSVFALGRSSGSPPRGRGKGLGLAVNVLGDGIIPAWAGKSYCPATRSFGSWDHPRADGEKGHPVRLIDLAVGSPPRRRGKAEEPREPGTFDRITPAWAGKSYCPATRSFGSWDHPRADGEKGHPVRLIDLAVGSPPRRRGKVRHSRTLMCAPGITPAWAGKSCGWASCGGLSWDHPRMGGEKLRMGFLRGLVLGSPPHGRGKDDTAVQLGARAGITPAWAGKRSG